MLKAKSPSDAEQPLLLDVGSPYGQDHPAGPRPVALAAAGRPAPGSYSSEDETVEQTLEAALAKADAVSRKAALRQMTGLALYAVSTVFGSAMSLMAKLAGQRGVGVFEVVLIRSLFLVVLTGPELLWRRVNPFGDKTRRWLYLLRGVLGYLSVSSLFVAVSLLPMGDAAVLSFLSPIFVAAMSPLVLRERPSKGVVLAIPFCFAGVVLVAKPSFIFGQGKAGAISGMGVTVGILQAVFNAAARMAVRALSLGSNEPMAAILFSMGLVSSVLAAATLGALRIFVLPRGFWLDLILLANGLCGYLYQVTLTAGLQRADAAPAVAMSYLGVIWGIVADILVFHSPPTPLSLAGAAVITLSSFFVAFGERRRQLRAKARLRWEASAERLMQEAARSPTSGYSTASSRTNLLLLLPPAPPSAPGSDAGGSVHSVLTGAEELGLGKAKDKGKEAAAAAAGGMEVVGDWGEGEGVSTPSGPEPLVAAPAAGVERAEAQNGSGRER